MKNFKNVLSLDSKEAMDFFMCSDSYCNFELPKYYCFDDILKYVRETVGDAPYNKCIDSKHKPEEFSDVNMNILLNKDGAYGVRPLVLANPYLYYFLVREVCNEKSWKTIKNLFGKFNVPHIASCALPVLQVFDETEFPHKTTILNWWNNVEQRSIELSLKYRYMFVTDITNCYGSVNPQTFDWAFTLKDTSMETKRKSPISKNIQDILCAFQNGRNIGIPQGSVIFDFIGEILLGYADLLLYEAIKDKGIKCEYDVIRYRDDYRIFCDDKGALEEISYSLQGVLEKLNFRMNGKKTMISDSIVTDAIKPEKRYLIEHKPMLDNKNLQKQLLEILFFSRKFPNCGQLRSLLSEFDGNVKKRLEKYEKPVGTVIGTFNLCDDDDSAKNKNEEDKKAAVSEKKTEKNPKESIFDKLKKYPGPKQQIKDNIAALSAILAQIALENVNSTHYALQVFSRLVDSIDDDKQKCEIITAVCDKLMGRHNSTYDQIWLQNITYQRDKNNNRCPYNVPLCKLAMRKNVEVWNNTWLQSKFTDKLPLLSICDGEKLKELSPVISFRKRSIYDDIDYFEKDIEAGLSEQRDPDDILMTL